MDSAINKVKIGKLYGYPNLSEILKAYYKTFGDWTSSKKAHPIVYSPKYNVKFYGFEKLHPFDSCKFEKIIHSLSSEFKIAKKEYIGPKIATREILEEVHEKNYLKKLETSTLYIAQVTELVIVVCFPNFLVQRHVMNPFKYHVNGTILAIGLAIEHGWAINIGGGMHHACYNKGEGWCAFDDIYIAIRNIRRATNNRIMNVMIIDLDVHQGNGIEKDKMHFNDDNLFIFDAYNYMIFPNDTYAKQGINIDVHFPFYIKDDEYLEKLNNGLEKAKSEFKPDLIVYNAGTDILINDPLGGCCVTSDGILKRDEAVFNFASEVKVPIAMVLSGGYAKGNADVVSLSLINLIKKFNLKM